MTTGSVLEQLGGRDGLTIAVGALYERILDDPQVAPYFDDTHLPTLRAHMVDFLVAALSDEPRLYGGRALDEAHTGLGITDAQFDRVVGHIDAVLRGAHAPAATIDQVIGRLAPLRPAIIAPAGL